MKLLENTPKHSSHFLFVLTYTYVVKIKDKNFHKPVGFPSSVHSAPSSDFVVLATHRTAGLAFHPEDAMKKGKSAPVRWAQIMKN